MKQFYVFFMSLLASLNVSAQDKVMTIDNQKLLVGYQAI